MHESDIRWRDFYNRWAGRYDFMSRLWSILSGFSDTGERRKLVGRLDLKPGHRLLEVSVGTGRNLPIVGEAVGPAGHIVGLDISIGMLRRCQEKLLRRGPAADLIEGEGSNLPFPDEAFDAVLHFGGINEFGEKEKAMEEMVRVAKPGAKIVVSDESLAPQARTSLRGKLLIRMNALYAHDPPMELVPEDAVDVNLTWFRGKACYLIDFAKPGSRDP